MNRVFSAAVVLTALAAMAGSSAASAHVTLETREAAAGAYYKAVLRISHGCEGSPTVRVRVQMPDGVSAVKPQPKPGWEVEAVRAKLAQPVTDSHGKTITEAVREIVWSGGRLLDEHYDEFAVRVKLPDRAGETLYFRTVQECERGVHRWIEVPEPGKTASDYKEPAPSLRLTARS